MLSEAELRSFGEQGWLRLPDAVPPDVLAAAQDAVAERAAADPVGASGPSFDFPDFMTHPEYAALFAAPRVASAVEDLLGPGAAEPLVGCQLARTLPPSPRPGPGRPHVDGTVGEVGGRPGTFSLLVGVALSDQTRQGGLWVWPGSHREHAAHFASHGPESFWSGDAGFVEISAATPVQLQARPGDAILCHYLLGHCPGGVDTIPRATAYARVTRRGHVERWREAMSDWRLDFPPVAAALPV